MIEEKEEEECFVTGKNDMKFKFLCLTFYWIITLLICLHTVCGSPAMKDTKFTALLRAETRTGRPGKQKGHVSSTGAPIFSGLATPHRYLPTTKSTAHRPQKLSPSFRSVLPRGADIFFALLRCSTL